MLGITTALGGHDTMEVLLPILSHPVYRADAANNWATTLLPNLPKWLIVTDKAALQPFYSGNSTLYKAEHLRAWISPGAGLVGVSLHSLRDVSLPQRATSTAMDQEREAGVSADSAPARTHGAERALAGQ